MIDPTTGLDDGQPAFSDPSQQGGFLQGIGNTLGNIGQGIGHFAAKAMTQDPRYPPGVSPLLSALGGLAQGYGQAAMPSRMPVPFGAVMGMGAGGMEQGLNDAQKNMSMYQQAQGQQIQNQMAQTQLPIAQAQSKMQLGLLNNPALLQQMMGGGTMPQGAPAYAPLPGQAPAGLTGALNSLPDDKTRNMTIKALLQANVPQEGWAPFIATVHGESGFNMTPKDNQNANGTYDVGPAQVNSSHLGEGGLTDAQLRDPQTNLNKGAQIWAQSWNAAGGNPIKAMAAYNTGQPTGTPPAYAPKAISMQNDWSGAGQGQPGSPPSILSPGDAFNMFQQLNQRANMAPLLGKLGGDPTELRKTANSFLDYALAGSKAAQTAQGTKGVELQMNPQIAAATGAAELPSKVQAMIAQNQIELQNAGPKAAAVAQNSNLDIRPGGMTRTIGPDGQSQWIKNPQLEEVTDEATGQKRFVHMSPALPGSAPGTPGEASPVMLPGGEPAVAAIPKQQQEGRDAAVHDFLTKDQDSYQAAQNTQGWLNQIDHAAKTMSAAGPAYMTGPFANQRLTAMSGVNDMARSIGITPPFDQNAVASWEEMKKATTTAGFELSSHYEGHARQAAATIMNATSAVPAQSNSPVGQALVSAGIREGAQSAIDAHQYKQDVYNKTQGAGLENAETDFYKQNTPTMYANRAISTTQPFKVTSQDDFNKFLPGTYVTLPNGKLTQVPMRQGGAPPIPAYLQPGAPH